MQKQKMMKRALENPNENIANIISEEKSSLDEEALSFLLTDDTLDRMLHRFLNFNV